MSNRIDHFPNLIIRRLVWEDLPSLEWDGEFVHFRRLYAEAYRRSREGEAVLWVAELSDRGVIGQVFVQLKSQRHDLADGGTRAYIYGFRVRPPYRQQGVGTRLLQTLEEDLIERGFRRAVLNVARINLEARRFYERKGYRVIGRDPGRWSYLDENGARCEVHEPAWKMAKELKCM